MPMGGGSVADLWRNRAAGRGVFMPLAENRAADKCAGLVHYLRMSSTWTRAIFILAAVWIIAGGTIWWVHHSRPTPESLRLYIESHPLDGQAESERAKRLAKVADQLNGLDFEARQGMRGGRKMDGFFKSLTSAEQMRFLDLTLPAGFKQMMEGFNKMPPVERKKFVGKALAEMKQHEGEAPPEGMPEKLDANAEKIINQGLKSFYSEASAETKMDLSPLLEQMQKNLQGLR